MKSYITQLNKAFCKVSETQVKKAIDILSKSSLVFIVGNGGSSALASHFANDLNKVAKIPAICLSDNVPTLTAWANDKGYQYIFSEQLKNFKSYTLVVISSSGNSPNILNAIKEAKKNKVIALVGFKGGRVKADAIIHVPSDDYGIIEPIHDAITHYITRHFKNITI